jgi:hypothetical protein
MPEDSVKVAFSLHPGFAAGMTDAEAAALGLVIRDRVRFEFDKEWDAFTAAHDPEGSDGSAGAG